MSTVPVDFLHLVFMESDAPGEVHAVEEASASGCPITDFLSCRAESRQVITEDDEYFEFQTRSFGGDFQVDMYVCLSPLNNYNPIHTWNSSGACSFPNGGYHHWQTELLDPDGFEFHQWGLYFSDNDGFGLVQDPAHSGPFPQWEHDSDTVVRLIRRDGDLIVSVPAALPDFVSPPDVWVVNGDRAEYTYSRPASATDDFIGHAAATGPLFDQPFVPAAPPFAALKLVIVTSGAVGVEAENQPGIEAVTFTSADAEPGSRRYCDSLDAELN